MRSKLPNQSRAYAAACSGLGGGGIGRPSGSTAEVSLRFEGRGGARRVGEAELAEFKSAFSF